MSINDAGNVLSALSKLNRKQVHALGLLFIFEMCVICMTFNLPVRCFIICFRFHSGLVHKFVLFWWGGGGEGWGEVHVC